MRRRVLAAVLVVVLAVAGTLVYFLRYRTDHRVTPVDIAEAVAVFADGSVPGTVAAEAAAVLPEPGVYTYATEGGDRIDALGGGEHTYPATTTIVVTPDGCGVVQQWIAAEERFDQFLTCADETTGGVALKAFTEFHRFFNTDNRDDYLCAGEPRPIGAPAGTTWTVRCSREGEDTVWHGTVLEPATLTVGGDEVPVEHVEWTIDNGDDRDRLRTETWYLAGTDLVVKRVLDNGAVEGSVVGDVTYTERATITLTDLTPVR